jgi:hypothetical protein
MKVIRYIMSSLKTMGPEIVENGHKVIDKMG